MLSEWVKKALDYKGMTQAALAVQLSSRLNRSYDRSIVNKMVKGLREISASELFAISSVTGFPLPELLNASARPLELQEPEVSPYQGPPIAVSASPSIHQSWWTVSTRALEMEGYCPGDAILLDQSISPRDGDIVCAQHYAAGALEAVTKFRLYKSPYLLTRTMDPSIKELPLLVDQSEVVIMGVVIKLVRERLS